MKPIIKSEFGTLQKVLVHSPGKEHKQVIPWEGDHVLMGPNPRLYSELQRDHTGLKNYLIKEIGEENVLELGNLLADIFEDANYSKRFSILQDTLHHRAETYVDHLQARGVNLAHYDAKEIVKDLIQGYPRKLTINNGKLPQVIVPPKRELMWVRDAAAVTPLGVIINQMASPRRKDEPTLVRSVFKYHPMFDKDSIFLDMVQFHREMYDDLTSSGLHEKFILEGGNIMVLSEDTIAIGVGNDNFEYANRTTRPAFRHFIRKVFADPNTPVRRVYLVNIPDLKGFIHLDTVFNMLGPQSAVAMPYIFGYPKPSRSLSPKKVLQQFVEWIRQYMGANQSDLTHIPTRDHFEHAGKVEVYDRDHINKTGSVERLPIPSRYFLDQLLEDGLIDLDKIVWVAGNPGDYVSPFEHLKNALFEQQNMAANVLTVKPFRTVAFDRNPVTINHLQDLMGKESQNADLQLMSSNEIRTDNGGPHCLTMPLLRGE